MTPAGPKPGLKAVKGQMLGRRGERWEREVRGKRGSGGRGRVGKGSEEESDWRQLELEEEEEEEEERFCSGPRAWSPPHFPSSAARSRTGRS